MEAYEYCVENVSSPSTRRAWIEIELTTAEILQLDVALHPEGVDRNTYGII